jgi:hypothetical protein
MLNCTGLILSSYFNFFDIYIFLIVLSIYTFFMSSIMFIFDKSHPYEILLRLYKLNRYDKLKFAFISFPISILYSIVYVDLDNVIIQIISGTTIVTNALFSVLINKNYRLINIKVIILIAINIVGCILPFIVDLMTLRENRVGIFGLIFILVLQIISGLIFSIIEKLKDFNHIDLKNDCYTFTTFTLLLSHIIYLILFSPLIYFIQISYYDEYTIDLNNLLLINLIATAISIINGPLLSKANRSIIRLSSFHIGLVNNSKMILMTFISIMIGYSEFNYIYLISLGLIIVSSLCLLYLDKHI